METQITQLLKTEVRTSWPNRLKSLVINGKPLKVDPLFTSTVRQAISKLHKESEFKFTTSASDKVLIVIRTN